MNIQEKLNLEQQELIEKSEKEKALKKVLKKILFKESYLKLQEVKGE
jgi:hypothetical protein